MHYTSSITDFHQNGDLLAVQWELRSGPIPREPTEDDPSTERFDVKGNWEPIAIPAGREFAEIEAIVRAHMEPILAKAETAANEIEKHLPQLREAFTDKRIGVR